MNQNYFKYHLVNEGSSTEKLMGKDLHTLFLK